MRKTYLGLALIATLFVVWSAWPFIGLYGLARAVQSGDVTRIEERVDFAALGQSLSAQILQSYSRLTGIPADRGGLVGSIASAVADPVIARLLTRVAVAELVHKGWPSDVIGPPPPQFRGIDWSALGNAWQIYANSEYGIGTFRVWLPVDAPRPRQYRVHLGLRAWSWKLIGLDIPPGLTDRLAQELVKQQGVPNANPSPLLPSMRR